MKIKKKHEDSDPVTYSSIWWIPGWVYIFMRLSDSVEYEKIILPYIVISFVVWFIIFFKIEKIENV